MPPLRPSGTSAHALSVGICCLLLALASPLFTAFAAADTTGDSFIFILDASGSMAAQIQGRPKIEVAKEVLTGLIKDLPATTKVGLFAYGHRQKGDCSDVEELAPMAPVNKEALITQIAGLRPKGMTPLTASVQKVAEGLQRKGEQATIVLISDGEETCKGDPCAVVRELKAAGAAFVLHVIGFDVNVKGKKQLSCIAGAGGGVYYAAADAKELKLAARQVVEKKEPPQSTLTVRAMRNGQPLAARCEVLAVGPDAPGPGKMVGSGMTEKGSTVFTLPPGTYDLQVENTTDPLKPTLSFQGINLGPGEQAERLAEFSGGSLIVKALRNGAPVTALASISTTDAATNKTTRITSGTLEAAGKEFKLAPGVYDVTVEDLEDADKPIRSLPGIAVEAAKTVEKTAEFSGGGLTIKALKNGKPVPAFCMVYRAGDDEEKEKEKVAESPVQPDGASLKLTPGTYDAVVVNQEDATRPTINFQGLVIEAGKAVEKTAEFSGGDIRVSALRNGKPFSAGIFIDRAQAGGGARKERLINDYTGVDGKIWRLPPGTYDITVINREDAGRPTQTFPGIVVAAGATVEKTADFSGGGLKIGALRNGKPFSATVFVDTVPQQPGGKKERVVNDHSGIEGRTWKLPPGTYDVTVINAEDAGRPTQTFPGIVVAAGATVEKTADFSGGGIKVGALRNGKPFSATVFVDTVPQQPGGKKERVVNDHSGIEGRTWKLPPGTYDITVINAEDAGRPTQTFPGIVVAAGAIVEKTADFVGGGLKVTATEKGAPFSATLFIERAADAEGKKKERLVNDLTGAAGKTYNLPPGVYDITVINQKDPKKATIRFPDIQVKAGEITEKTAAF